MDNNVVCVLFPGIVKNDEKALQCLGGIKYISQVNCQSNKKRLGLSFQPDNPYVKKIYSDPKPTAGVLLKVRVKKVKIDNEIKRKVVSTAVVGRVNKIYRFEFMCDFQYLPIHRENTASEPQCILEKIFPSGTDAMSFLFEPAPNFIVPANFTRFDKQINYAYTDKRCPEKREVTSDTEDDVHYRKRSDRGKPLAHFNFNLTENLPTEPHEFYIIRKNLRLAPNPKLLEDFETVKKLFEERPIWSFSHIKYLTKIRNCFLKIMMPCLSIYLKNGPWRMLWVRFGYDPREDPGARKYQTLDFRLRQTAGVRSMVMTRDKVVHCKKSDQVKSHNRWSESDSNVSEEVHEGSVCFRPGMVPAQRQIFYQYCDVHLPEVVDIIAAEPPPGFLCHQSRGWLPPNAADLCRDHIFRYVQQTLLASHSAELKFDKELSSDDDGSNSDYDNTSTTATEIDEPSTSNT